jgi:hypothetical protein
VPAIGRTDFGIGAKMLCMKAASQPQVVEIERRGGGVLIAFSNGEGAHYPVELSHSMIDKASKLPLTNGSRAPAPGQVAKKAREQEAYAKRAAKRRGSRRAPRETTGTRRAD